MSTALLWLLLLLTVLAPVPVTAQTIDTFEGWFNATPLFTPTPRFTAEGWCNVGPLRTDLNQPVGRSYSGAVVGSYLDEHGQRIAFVWDFGGHDQSHQGNDIEAIEDTHALVWRQSWEPEVWCPALGTDATLGLSPLGRPYAVHMYQRAAADDQGRVYAALGHGLWRYDVRGKHWTKLTASIPRATSDGTGITIVYTGGKVLLFNWSPDSLDPVGGNHAYQYNNDGDEGYGTWTALAPMSGPGLEDLVWGENMAAAHARDGYVLIAAMHRNGGRLAWFRYWIAARQFEPLIGPTGHRVALGYDSDREHLVAVTWNVDTGTLATYMYDGRQFTPITGGAAFPVLVNWPHQTPVEFNPFGYDPVRKTFWLLWNIQIGGGGHGGHEPGDVQTWAYRVPHATPLPGPPPLIPPARPLPPVTATMIAENLGIIQGDIAEGTETDPLPTSPTPAPNWRIRLSGLSAIPERIVVKGVLPVDRVVPSAGGWYTAAAAAGYPYPYYGIRVTPIDATTLDLQGAVYNGIDDFMVTAIELGLTQHAALDGSPPPPPPLPADVTGTVTLKIPRRAEPILIGRATTTPGDAAITHVWIEVAGHRILNLRETATPETWKGRKSPVIFDDTIPVVLWAQDALGAVISLPLSCVSSTTPRGRVSRIVCEDPR